MAANLRQRPTQQAAPSEEPQKPNPKKSDRSSENEPSSSSFRISVLDIIRVLVTLTIASCGLSYYVTGSKSLIWGYPRPWFTKWPAIVTYINGPLLLTPSQLAEYDGTDASKPIYVAVNGTIFDVSANRMTYGPGGSYHFFSGKDASRAFVTGCFQEDLTPDMEGVEEMFIPVDDIPAEEEGLTSGERKRRKAQELRDAKAKVRAKVAHWENFFRDHEKYFEVGKVVGVEPRKPGEPKRELCAHAKKARPKRSNMKKK